MFEADLLLLQPVFSKPDFASDWRDRWQLWNQVFTRHNLDPNLFAAVRPAFYSAFEAVHREFARQKGAVIWGDKSPNYHDHMMEMARTFPGARFIVVWREPLHTVGATLRAATAGSRYFRKRGMPWRSLLGYRIFTQQCTQAVAAGIPVHQVHYENLVTDTAKAMRGVCTFLGIPYDESLCTLEGADRSAVYTGRHHDLLRNNAILREPREDVMDPALRNRVERYAALWNHIDEGSPENKGLSTQLQRKFDLFQYRAYRAIDLLIRLGFCFLPTSLLRSYRRLRDNREARRFTSILFDTQLRNPANE